MAKITPFDYHSDEANHGNYQYIPLKEIVNTLLLEFSDDDHYLKNVRRTTLLSHAKNAIRKFNKQVFNDVRAMEITVPTSLVIAMPHNYVDYVRVSVVIDDNGTYRLKPLNINKNMNIADGYLQDHDAEILFDEDGGILMADSSNIYARPYKKYEFDNSSQRTLDTSQLSKYGEFTIDERRGKIGFSSDLSDREIVLEYVSDGLEFDTYGEEQIRVHKDVVELIKENVYFSCISGKVNVPANEKERARRRYLTTKHEAKLDRSGLDFLEISKAMNLSSKNI